MKSLPRNAFRAFLVLIAAGAFVLTIVLLSEPASGAPAPLPKVQFSAEGIAPRPIEDLTRAVVARDYALAWQSMAQALAENRPALLDAYFTGFARHTLTEQIAKQRAAGVRLRYTDLGHKVSAFFYAPAGDAMQLRDQAELRIEILDGTKVIHSEQVHLHYMVLMTPGADRWLVRDLETTPDVQP